MGATPGDRSRRGGAGGQGIDGAASAMLERLKEIMPEDASLHRWLDMVNAKIPFHGLPARNCRLGLHDRARAGLALNDMYRRGELTAPVVIGRDHVSSGSVASPNRESEGMLDGSDAVSDWALLNALLNCASGATWVSIHHADAGYDEAIKTLGAEALTAPFLTMD